MPQPRLLEREASYADDLELAARCAAGDESAVGCLIERCDASLRSLLLRRGASETLAEELVADLWGDCFAVGPDRLSLLARYSGRSLLSTWLGKVLTHRWLDRLRRDRKRADAFRLRETSAMAVTDTPPDEPALADLLRKALAFGFGSCPPESLVMLQLVHLHGLSQRAIAAVWGVSEFRVSRQIRAAMRQISQESLQFLRKADPHLRMCWEDLVGICASMDLATVMKNPSGDDGKCKISPAPRLKGYAKCRVQTGNRVPPAICS